jgi:hypothetical protein
MLLVRRRREVAQYSAAAATMATISPAIAAPPCSAAPSFLEVLGTGSVAAPVELDFGAVVTAGALPLATPVP